MTTTVFRGVKADQGTARNEHVAIDDRPADTGVAADAYTGHEDGLIDVTKTVDPHVRAEHAALHAAPGNDAAARDDRIERLTAAPVLLGEDELRRWCLRLVGAERPFRVVQIELRVDLAEIHAGVEIGVEGADVAPVFRRLLVLVVETVGKDRPLLNERGQDVPAEVVLAVGARRVFLQGAHQHVGLEDVDTHRGKSNVARAGRQARVRRLFLEFDYELRGVDGDDAEAARVAGGCFDCRNRGVAVFLEMVAKHLRVIHLVDVVARQHDDVARHLARNRIEILVYGVGRAEVPMLADTLLRGEEFDEFAELFGHDVPAHPDVTVERKRLVLGADEDPAQAGIHAIAEREIDNPVMPAEVNRGVCALFSERKKTFPGAASEQNDENVVEDHDQGSPRAGVAILALRALTWLLRGAYDQPIRLIGFVLRGP